MIGGVSRVPGLEFLALDIRELGPGPGQGQVRFITRPKSRTMRATRQLMLPPNIVSWYLATWAPRVTGGISGISETSRIRGGGNQVLSLRLMSLIQHSRYQAGPGPTV